MGIGAYKMSSLTGLALEPNAQPGSAIDAALVQPNHTLVSPLLAAVSSPMPAIPVTQARMLEWVRAHE